ncbi:hypothetical protein B0I31_12248 [Saccharothrix carnea]|uniref:Uncharacterized protein n=1 Tax=Saccharothrix carnea TaxID=1280637 RepID=A0A2P8HXU3_SACCR|nr:hypothetical protein [Saccharothrix carnea]PSL51052.1 hypothetical protein B0I31_12248 [Saccharothrix carnea]
MSGEKSKWGVGAAVLGAVAALISALAAVWAEVGDDDSEAASSSAAHATVVEGQQGGRQPNPVPVDRGGDEGGEDTKAQFTVTGLEVSVSPSDTPVSCDDNVRFTFSGTVTTNGTGEVAYRWAGTDGTSDRGTVQVGSTGRAEVESVTLSLDGARTEGGYVLEVTAPNAVSDSASVTCAPTEPEPTTDVMPKAG